MISGCLIGSAQETKKAEGGPIPYRVGFLGLPDSVNRFVMNREVPWTRENLRRLKDLGFNTIQVNVGWGTRPADEIMNLEDVVALDEAAAAQYSQPLELWCRPGSEARAHRRNQLSVRSELCRELGLRTIFFVGAPFNQHCVHGGTPPNCILDEKILRRYELLLEKLAREFPQIDDVLVYTYDADAWLCSEFEKCPRCAAVPLHARLPQFLNRLTAVWRKERPTGRLWWEPWELSAGQVYQCVDRIEPAGFGLALHINIAEVMSTFPVDRWLKNTAGLAAERGMPVIVEYFLGGVSEETEPLFLAHPLVTLRGLQAIARLPGVVGIKEYYGLAPEREDANLRMTGLFFGNPQIREQEALEKLSAPYGDAAADVRELWRRSSQAMEFFPWEATWLIRQFGKKHVWHSLRAEMRIEPMNCPTPSWESSRNGIFIRANSDIKSDHPWLTEDMQLRLEKAVSFWRAAEKAVQAAAGRMPEAVKADFTQILLDTGRMRRRATGLMCHARETNLARLMRSNAKASPEAFDRARKELLEVLKADRENYREELRESPRDPLGQTTPQTWAEIDAAIELLEQDPQTFVKNFFIP